MRTLAALFLVVGFTLAGQSSAFGQTAADWELSGFDRILERVVERDETTEAIVTVAPLKDAADPDAKLVLTIKPIVNTKNVLVELRDSRDRTALFESYRFRSSEKLTAEADKLKKPRTTARNVSVKPAQVVLKVPHVAQGKNLCAPASASMILQFYGQPGGQEKIKELANSVSKRPDFAGTFYVDIVGGLKTIGVEWSARGYKTDAAGFEDGMKEILKSLDEGHPVMVDLHVPPDGHTVVVAGYDPNRKLLFLVDPLMKAPGHRVVTYAEFSEIWKALVVDTRGLILTKPAPK